jgi:hypothetical protein
MGGGQWAKGKGCGVEKYTIYTLHFTIENLISDIRNKSQIVNPKSNIRSKIENHPIDNLQS